MTSLTNAQYEPYQNYESRRIQRIEAAGWMLANWLHEHRAEIIDTSNSLYGKVYKKWLWCTDQVHEYWTAHLERD